MPRYRISWSSPAGPLVAQNGRYVRYLTLYNQVAFDFIVKNKLYLRSNLPVVPTPRPATPVLPFPIGSIALKTAWIDLRGFSKVQQQRVPSLKTLSRRGTNVASSCTIR